jgi:outer membrane protein OmpA-like peptidoglycan-associated protein
MKLERRSNVKSKIKLEVKRSAELWLYSFADMFMIIAVFFIAMTAVYSKRPAEKAPEVLLSKEVQPKIEDAEQSDPIKKMSAPSAARGPEAAQLQVGIEFLSGSAELTPEALENLDTILPLLSGLKNGFVEIEGYADAAGLKDSEEYDTDIQLSSDRAVRVAEWFMKRGVAEGRLRTTAFGKDHKFQGRLPAGQNDRKAVVKFYSAGPG